MSLAKDLTPSTNPQDNEWNHDVVIPPCDLPSDEPPLESYLHLQQLLILLKCLDWWWRDRNDYFAAGNLTIYFNENHIKSRDFRGPDFFVVLNTERKPRKSWVVWAEGGKYPDIIVEVLSESTATTDRDFKKQLYQNIFRTPDYFWFDPETLEFAGFHLVDGQYQPLEPTAEGRLWSHQLQLFLGIHQQQLRFFTSADELVPTPEEAAIQAEELLTRYRQQFGELAD